MTPIEVVDALGQTKAPDAKAPDFSEETRRKLPQPTGYKVLVGIPKAEEKTESGLYKTAEAMRMEEIATVVGYVLALGPDAYQDPEKFPNGPYCEPGDFVIFRTYTGTRINVHGQELRLINDDSVEAVVDDPRGIVRAG